MIRGSCCSVITDEWRLFKDKLSRAEQSFASELRDTGNKWGHGTAFSADDTYRALDTMERLLAAVDATAEADEVRKLRRDAQQAAFASETRRAVQAVTGVEGHGLKPWREVIMPHRDVREREPARRGVRGGPVLRVAGRRVGGVRRPGGVLPAHLPDRGAAGPADLDGAADRRGPERAAGGEPADQLRRRQDPLDAGAVAPAVRDPADRRTRTSCRSCWPVTRLPGRAAGSRWSATTSRPGRARPSRTARRCRRCGASWPGSWAQRGRPTRRGARSRWCATRTRPAPTRARRSASSSARTRRA